MSLGMELGLGPGDFVLDGDPALLLKMGQSPRHQFSAHFYCGQMAGCIKMPLGMDIGLSPEDFCVRWRPSSPAPTRRRRLPPKSLAHVYCGQTAGWIKMPLGTKVGLSPGDSVLDGDPAALSTKGVEPPPQFSAHFHCGQTAGCIKMPLCHLVWR